MQPFSRLLMMPATAAAIAFAAVPAPASASDLAPSSVVDARPHTGTAAHSELLRFLLEPVTDASEFQGKRIAIVAGDGASAFELETTRAYFLGRGAQVHILAPRPAEEATEELPGPEAPREVLTTLDYTGERRLVGVTWYLDQVHPRDYDAVYVPNVLGDIRPLAVNRQTAQFMLAVQLARIPIFVSGNADAIVPGPETAGAGRPASAAQPGPVTQPVEWQVYTGHDAFDMPQLIRALAAALTTTPDRKVQ
jgi:hypothetical protein